MSEDWKLAMRYARDHRRMRTLPRFQERYLAPEVVENYRAIEQAQVRERTVAPGKGWAMAEKLKVALGMTE
jgi:hypothetical protein